MLEKVGEMRKLIICVGLFWSCRALWAPGHRLLIGHPFERALGRVRNPNSVLKNYPTHGGFVDPTVSKFQMEKTMSKLAPTRVSTASSASACQTIRVMPILSRQNFKKYKHAQVFG